MPRHVPRCQPRTRRREGAECVVSTVAGAEGDAAAGRIAATQRTIVDAEQLHACGIGKRAIEYRLAAGRLHVMFQGVYSFGCGELPPLALEQAALIACGEKSFLSQLSSAFVWGLTPQAPAVVDVSVVGRSIASREGLRVHRIREIDRRELRRREGLWVSSPPRVCLEVAATSPSDLPGVIDEGLAKRLLSKREIEQVLRRHRGRRGAARLAAILGDESAMTITRSRAEKAMLKLIRDGRLPIPEVNVRFGPYKPDFLWRSHKLIVELDSHGFHAGPRAFQNDREKDLYYRDAGFDVLRFTRAHVIYEPAIVLVRLVRALDRRVPA